MFYSTYTFQTFANLAFYIGHGFTRPWVHQITLPDITRMRISSRVGTNGLGSNGEFTLVRMFAEDGMEDREYDAVYKIARGDGRLEITGGWQQFVLENPGWGCNRFHFPHGINPDCSSHEDSK